MAGHVQEIGGSAAFNAALGSRFLVAADFSAAWCGPCKAIAPIFAQLAAQHPQILFLKVDVDANRELAEQFKVTGIPSFVFFKNSVVLSRLQGADPAKLQAEIASLASHSPGRTTGGSGAPASTTPVVQPTTVRSAAPSSSPSTRGAANASDRKPTEWYVGGGSSGQAVIAPPPPSTSSSGEGGGGVRGLFDRAKELGAVNVAPGTAASASTSAMAGSTTAFGGHGRRVGYQPGPSPVMAPVVKQSVTVRIVFYENGFVVDDGPLRSMTDPAQRDFLDSIKKGIVPQEIATTHPNAEVDVDLDDRSGEAYVEKFRAFAGTGSRLVGPGLEAMASAAPPLPPQAPVPTASSATSVAVCHGMLQLPSGARQPFDATTVGELRYRAARAAGGVNCELMVRQGVKTVKLSDDGASLEGAGGANALVIVKLVA